jgi:CDP-diacylglycerol--glycerol-3-phosphate 3-phosphatidyltransferase
MTAFGANNMMRSAFTEWLTAGRFMRAFFGYAKAAGFVFLTGLVADRTMNTDGTTLGALYGQDWYIWLGWALVWGAVALTIIRGLPVIYDSLAYMRELDSRKAASKS